MQDRDCNESVQHKTILSAITQTNLEEILQVIINSSNVQVLTKIFSTLGVYLLSTETCCDRIIKCDPLYDKVALVLNAGSQAKTTIALNFICALLYLNEEGQTRRKSLFIHAQNMIRISGCLTAMTNFFISFMLYQDTLKALCRSISEACRDSAANQACCSHLIPLCIRRCRGGSADMFIVLQSLLSNNRHNVKLFYDSDGITIFTRESLQYPICLQLLNTVVENTTSDNKEVLFQSSYLFEHLRYLQDRYSRSNPIGDWIYIILFSYRKVCNKNVEIRQIAIDKIEEAKNNESKNVYSNKIKNLNETNELFRNIFNEIVGYQNANFRRYRSSQQIKNSNINFPNKNYETKNVEEKRVKDLFNKPAVTTANTDYSFSFLLQDRPMQNNFKSKSNHQINQTIRRDRTHATHLHSNNNHSLLSFCKGITQNISQNLETISNSTLVEDDSFNFAPPFVSTPKKSKQLRSTSVSNSSHRSYLKLSRCKQNNTLTKINKETMTKRRLSESKQIQNKTLGAKFFDILNGSCTTIVKSFTCFKNIFRSKEPSTSRDEDVDRSFKTNFNAPSNSFTNYMRHRDAYSCQRSKNRDETLFTNEFSIADDKFHLQECNTCNDTFTLQNKFKNDLKLQRTVKRLKFGINLYGCDFKKISRVMWPNEHYMTPSVLYNLYRKLIVNK